MKQLWKVYISSMVLLAVGVILTPTKENASPSEAMGFISLAAGFVGIGIFLIMVHTEEQKEKIEVVK